MFCDPKCVATAPNIIKHAGSFSNELYISYSELQWHRAGILNTLWRLIY